MSNDKVKTIIDRSLAHTLDMSYCEDLMDWGNLESALSEISHRLDILPAPEYIVEEYRKIIKSN